MTTVLILLLVLLFISGAPLYTIMLGFAAIGAVSSARGFDPEFDGAVTTAFGFGTGDKAATLSAIPLFIYAGYLLAEARTADRLVRFANAMLGWFPGGLAIVTICTCALFTTFTGASGVTIVALGGLLLPALVKQGYPVLFSLGLIAGTGSVGLLFPPALPLFVYGTIYGLTRLDLTWDTRRFLFAGIVPGIVLIAMLSAVAVSVAVYKRLPRQKFDAGELGRSFLAALPELLIPFAVIGCLAIGFAPPEVAALMVVYVVALETLVLRQIKWHALWRLSHESLALVGALFIIIFAASCFTDYLVVADVPTKLINWTREHVEAKWVFLLAINCILLLVGTVMDIFSAIVVVLPLIAPIAKEYGVDPYHLGVIFLLNLEVGYLHPPVGLNLFITSLKFRKPVVEVMWATIPFLITMILALLVVTYVPPLTVVPEAERTQSLSSLIEIVHESVEDMRNVKEVPLVFPIGTPVPGDDGKQIVKQLASCEEATDDFERGNCKLLFTEVKQCREAPPEGKSLADCEREHIGDWVIKNLQVVTVKEVTLVDEDGKPVNGPDGKPMLKKHEECAAIHSKLDRDDCIELFVSVSNCRNSPPPEDGTVEGCEHEAIASWVDDNMDEDEEEADAGAD